MATARGRLQIVETQQIALAPESWEAFIERVAPALSQHVMARDAASWSFASHVVDVYAEAEARPDMQGWSRRKVHQRVNASLYAWWEEHQAERPNPSVLSNAAKVEEIFPEVFTFESKKLPYQHYMQLANCSLPPKEKEELRQWAETEKPRQAVLRQRIREEVDAGKGDYKPDFDLKVSNHWMFNSDKRGDGFAGGVNYELYANLIHAFSDPGDIILDPFAGGGILADTLKKYRHFREVTRTEFSGPRYALMSDITPTRPDILQADVRVGLPFDDACAHLAILDPPYFKMADQKYVDLGKVFSTWQDGMQAAIRQTARCLVPDGILVIMTDDVLRRGQHVPLGHHIVAWLEADGWQLITTIYNFNRNFLTMTPAAMAGTKHARFHVNATKVLQVATRRSYE